MVCKRDYDHKRLIRFYHKQTEGQTLDERIQSKTDDIISMIVKPKNSYKNTNG